MSKKITKSETQTVAPPIYPMPFVRIELAVLSIVDGRLSVLLGKRTGAPYVGQWALPGGVLRIDLDKDLDDAAQRVSMERLGTKVPFLRQLTAVGSKERDPRAPWALSIAFRALLPLDSISPAAGKRIAALEWRPADEAAGDVTLAFDHGDLIARAVAETRREVDEMHLPFDFLPEQFTLGELQQFCESLLGRRLDKSSFRRKLDDRGLVEPIAGAMKGGAFRPAQLFTSRY